MTKMREREILNGQEMKRWNVFTSLCVQGSKGGEADS